MTATRTELVLFDLDGTLADTLADIASAMNHTLVSHGLPPIAENDYRQYVGEGVARLVEKAIPQHRDKWDVLIGEFREYYTENLIVDSVPYPGVPDLLDDLQAAGLRLAVLSNKPDALTVRVVEALFSRYSFCQVRGMRADVPRKPAPDGALAIARHAGVDPQRCVLVGDTPIDIETGRRAGMRAFGVHWGFRRRDELADAGAEAVVETPGALKRLLLTEL